MTAFPLPIVDNGSDDAPAPEAPIANDGFFPDVDPAQFAREMRLRDGITPDRRRRALIEAIITVGNQLTGYRDQHMLAGAGTLADVTSPTIDGESRLLQLYRTAVFSEAKARLVERYRDADLTKAGKEQVEDLEPSIGELRRDSIYAVRDMLGVGRVAVALI
nr:head completion/stabilization protein [uncultured Sphingomonas sp.]